MQPRSAGCDPGSVRFLLLAASLAVAVAVAVAACGAAAPPPLPTRMARPASRDPFTTSLNLSFERHADSIPSLWTIRSSKMGSIKGYDVAIDDDAHRGTKSLKVRATGGGDFASTSVCTDATPFRGKRVRLRGWVKTDGVVDPGWAGVWLRTDGDQPAFDHMVGRGLVGTRGWRKARAQIDVPPDATHLFLGPMLVGPGTAWFDDLRIEVTEIPEDDVVRR